MRRAAGRRLGLPPEARLILFVGEERPEKRLDLIEAAVSRLQAQDPRVSLLKVTGKPHDHVPVYINAGDALVLASDIEASPVAIKEAMACNIPIVSTDVGDVG
jgi:teichuronic acid biosynthesis glycosyltransferase TuaC